MPVTVRMASEGERAVVVKATDGPAGSADAQRLAAEALVLELAAVPGVVELVRAGPTDDGGFELVTAHAGTRTLAGVHLPIQAVAGVVGALAATVADLHDLGIVHNRIRPEHVVLHATGRPVLCGFGGAGRAGQVVAGCELDPTDDVAALGELLLGLLVPGEPDGGWEPIPERRLGWRRSGNGFAQRALLNLADQAVDDDRSKRPTARAFAGSVIAAVPGATLGGTDVAATTVDGLRPAAGGHGTGSLFDDVLDAEVAAAPDPRRRAVTLAAGAAGLGLVVFGLGSVLGDGGPAPAEAAPEPVVGAPAPAAPAPTSPGAVIVDEAARVVEVDGVHYQVGRPGDLVLVDDWDCDGTTTVAVVRSSTGEVFVFDGWAVPGAPLTVPSLGRVPGAVRAAPSPGCDAVDVVTAAGAVTSLPMEAR